MNELTLAIENGVLFDLGILVAVIIGLTELVKIVIPAKYMPFISLFLGIVAGIVFVDSAIQNQVIIGIIMGLSASGLFDVGKVAYKWKKEKDEEANLV